MSTLPTAVVSKPLAALSIQRAPISDATSQRPPAYISLVLERFDGVSDEVDARLSHGASATSGASLEALTGIRTVCALSCKSALEDNLNLYHIFVRLNLSFN